MFTAKTPLLLLFTLLQAPDASGDEALLSHIPGHVSDAVVAEIGS